MSAEFALSTYAAASPTLPHLIPCDKRGTRCEQVGLSVLLREMVKWSCRPDAMLLVRRRASQPALTSSSCRTDNAETAMWNRSESKDPAMECSATAADWHDIRASLDGDGRAFERLVNRYQSSIGQYMWRFTRDRRELDELVQDVFVEAYFSLAKYGGRAPLLHWLKRIATRVGYRCWKQRRRRQPLSLVAECVAVTDTTLERDSPAEAAELVHNLLAQLAPRDRLIMTLTYLEGCNVKQSAQLTGWTETMVKVQTHRARKRLAQICAARGIEL